MMKERFKLAFTENKKAIIASAAILFAGLLIGYFFEDLLYPFLNPVVDQFGQNIESGTIQLTFKSLFSNNIRVVFVMFITGILFCFSAVILAFNGLFVGYFVASVNDLARVLPLIVPHGIFEFSSCILACASGFVLFSFVRRFLKGYGEQHSFYYAFNANADKLIQAIILLISASVLMAIAGFVEAYLTIPIAHFLSSILG